MDKEMLAKVNEILKAHGKRELTMDETDQVTGGGLKFDNFEINTREDLNYFVYTIIAAYEEAFGKDVTYNILKDWIPSHSMLDDYLHAGLDGLHNHLAIRLFEKTDWDTSF